MFREFNSAADHLAGMAKAGTGHFWVAPDISTRKCCRVIGSWDGGGKTDSCTCGWEIKTCADQGTDLDEDGGVWMLLATASIPLGDGTPTFAEITGAYQLTLALHSWFQHHSISFLEDGRVNLPVHKFRKRQRLR